MSNPVPTMPFVREPIAPSAAPNPYAGAGGVITPDVLGGTIFKYPTLAIWVGVAGNLHVVMGGIDVLLSHVPVGRLNISVTQVLSDTTTADGLVALN
jgi:hypothetical protein